MTDSVLDFIKDSFLWLIDGISKAFVDFFNFVIQTIADFCLIVIGILPDSVSGVDLSLPGDLAVISSSDGQSFMSILSWFLPINHIANSLMIYLFTVVLYFSVGPILRWVKIIK